MTAEFYLFDVDHGQASALRLPNGRWCIFDLGCTSSFSPIKWVVNRETRAKAASPLLLRLGTSPFRFLKATVSHFHGDHLGDYLNLLAFSPEFIRTVVFDQKYIEDCQSSNTPQSLPLVVKFAQYFRSNFGGSVVPDYGGALISELSLSSDVARQLGGDANARVNNASVITRIDVYGNAILLCGDMEKDAWDAIITDHGHYGPVWRPFLSNIDILVAPHHGHGGAYSTDLLNLAKPAVVLASVVSKDPNVDSRYSQDPVKGISIGKSEYRCITTRQKGHLKITISPPQSLIDGKGSRSWSFGDAACPVEGTYK